MAEAVRPAEAARERLTAELRVAMKARDPVATAVVRSLLSALDNASAVPLTREHMTREHAPVTGLSGDVARYDPTLADIARLFAAERDERREAEADYLRRGLDAEAERLRAEMAIITRLWPKADGPRD